VRLRKPLALAAAPVASALLLVVITPAPALAVNPIKPVCNVAGLVSGLVGKACKVAQNAPRVLKADKQFSHGHIGKAVKTFVGAGGGSAASSVASKATIALGLVAIGGWVLGGARSALHETAKVLSQTTTPQLRSTWFSSVYWRMAGVAAMLTLPFLFAAAIQALMRSDLGLLTRAAFGYLPLAMLAVGIAAPVTMLLLVASDQLSALVSSAAANASGRFLDRASGIVGVLTVFSGSPFLAFLVGIFTASAALVLWLELLVREAAVYVIVLMLPLAFAALVWPARRIWAIRAAELLVALILSKFAIVAVLSLGGAALSANVGGGSVAGAVAGGALVMMAAFSPWALLRLLPLAELAAGAAATLRADAGAGKGIWNAATVATDRVGNWLATMRSQAEEVGALGAQSDSERDRAAMIAGGGEGPNATGTEAELADAMAPGAFGGGVGEAAAATGAPGGEGEVAASAAAEAEPSPGMDDRWQAADFQWRPLTLGFDADEAPVVWPNQDGGARAAGEHEAPSAGAKTSAPDRDPRPADDHDPRPAEQPPPEGRL